jgi:hypothetical protein
MTAKVSTTKLTPATQDNFNSGLTSKWGTASPGENWFVNSRLEIPHVPAFTGFVESTHNIDITKQNVWVELVSTPTPGNNSKMSFFTYSTGDGVTNALFNLRTDTNPALSTFTLESTNQPTTTISYNPVAHRWLRFRLTGTYLVYETSPDAKVWTVRGTVPRLSWMTNTDNKVSFQAGSWNNDTTQGYTIWDNFCIYPT